MQDRDESDAATRGLSLDERLSGPAAFLPVFESPTFSFGSVQGGGDEFPWFALSADGARFVDLSYRLGWVVPGFDWIAWIDTKDARQLVSDSRAVEHATAEDLEHLLTAHIRQDRFSEGHLGAMFESGHLSAIVRRADALLREIDT